MTTDTTALAGLNIHSDNQTPIALDNEGHLVDHTLWSEAVAQQLADILDVSLTTEHYAVLHKVREFHNNFNHPPSTRPLIKYLMKTLPDQDISNQKLQQMFNTGLVARHVNRIAGLPKPPNCL
ncbi:TusE/DsrC/DsvC family sulfur relay protein [Psychrobacter sp. FDAARGOS_221]|uniref:TusE/DsrC/DsvC family sulfur relay protein n=1 Tax=Psychrobacter sp. FDAARGOS_221 TaxID=1975705 RepID=UPI000BB54418|nr:TusE/DsrC/DsvC family sulfur relay protein [Psychrobacter sp. FDAARGOS_221]PNK59447.1 TusE/DsrC/DsvC family sulfur relay protein [Psychrobacter sp. FDAARGOS_221]PNK61734.1 TusE/DsrC/DsvC family sulfur relay protein [Psychrobacter sp. FDAARGOS_221]